MMMLALSAGVSGPTLLSSRYGFAPFMVASRSTSRVVSGAGRLVGGFGHGLAAADAGSPQLFDKASSRVSAGVFWSRIIWFTIARCIFMHTRIWVKKYAVIVHSTSTDSEGSIPTFFILS